MLNLIIINCVGFDMFSHQNNMGEEFKREDFNVFDATTTNIGEFWYHTVA